MKEKISSIFEPVKFLFFMLILAIASKRNMAKKLGHKLTWSGWLQYLKRAAQHSEERRSKYYNLEWPEFLENHMKTYNMFCEELCIDKARIDKYFELDY